MLLIFLLFVSSKWGLTSHPFHTGSTLPASLAQTVDILIIMVNVLLLKAVNINNLIMPIPVYRLHPIAMDQKSSKNDTAASQVFMVYRKYLAWC